MPSKLEQLIAGVVRSAGLEGEEKKELREELTDHIMCRWEVLMLNGQSEEQAIKDIMESFGKPEEVGKQIHRAHSRLARIPFIGQLITDPGVMFAAQLTVMHFAALVMLPIATLIVLGMFDSLLFDGQEDPAFFWLLERVGMFFFLVVLLVPALAFGRHVGRRIHTGAYAVQIAFISVLPLLVIAGMLILNKFLKGQIDAEYVSYMFRDQVNISAVVYIVVFIGVAYATARKKTTAQEKYKKIEGKPAAPIVVAGIIASIGGGIVLGVNVLFTVFAPPVGTVAVTDIQWHEPGPIIQYYDGMYTDHNKANYIAQADGAFNFTTGVTGMSMIYTTSGRRFWYGVDLYNPGQETNLYEIVDGQPVLMELPVTDFKINNISESPDGRYLYISHVSALGGTFYIYDEANKRYLPELSTILPQSWVEKSAGAASVQIDIEWISDKDATLFIIVRDNDLPLNARHRARFTLDPATLILEEYDLDADYGPLEESNSNYNPRDFSSEVQSTDGWIELDDPMVGMTKVRRHSRKGDEGEILASWFDGFSHYYTQTRDIGDGKTLLQIDGRFLVVDNDTGDMALLFEDEDFDFSGMRPFDLYIF